MGKIAAFTYGDGYFSSIRDLIAARFEKLNDIPTRALGPEHLNFEVWNGAWVKSFLWNLVEDDDVEQIIWIDVDVIPTRPIVEFIPTPDIPFAAALDFMAARTIAERDEPEVTEIEHYFNTGLFIASRETIPVFKRVNDYMPRRGKPTKQYAYWDQTPINIEVDHEFGSRTRILPPTTNWLWLSMGKPPEDVHMVHYAGWRGIEERVRQIGKHLIHLDPEGCSGALMPEQWRMNHGRDNNEW